MGYSPWDCKQSDMTEHTYTHIGIINHHKTVQIRSDQISRSVVSDSLRPHESQHARPPCPSPTPGVHWESRPLSQLLELAKSAFQVCVLPFPTSSSLSCIYSFWYNQRPSLMVKLFFITIHEDFNIHLPKAVKLAPVSHILCIVQSA